MNEVLNKNLFFVKEHTGILKAANNYDIVDPETQELLITCREEKLGFFTKMLRFTDYKRMTPFNVVLKDAKGNKILTVKRGINIFLSKVQVLDENDNLIGMYKQKLFSIGGKFNVHDHEEKHICTLKGKWTAWDYKFLKEEEQLAHVSKKWAGVGKELFTTADNYMLEVDEKVPANDPKRPLIMGAVMCIDMCLKE